MLVFSLSYTHIGFRIISQKENGKISLCFQLGMVIKSTFELHKWYYCLKWHMVLQGNAYYVAVYLTQVFSTFCHQSLSLQLCCPRRKLLAMCGYWAPQMWWIWIEMSYKCKTQGRLQRLSKKRLKSISLVILILITTWNWWYLGHTGLN